MAASSSKMARGWLAMLAVLLFPAKVQSADPQGAGNIDVQRLCFTVAEKFKEHNPQHPSARFHFQTEIYKAANVKLGDTEEQVNAKVKSFLNAAMPRLLCNYMAFGPSDINVLKLAVSGNSNDFIEYALLDWKLDLNQIDDADGRTVLDHIIALRDSYAEGTGSRRLFQNQYNFFRESGAKTRDELAAEGAAPTIAQAQKRIISNMIKLADTGAFQSALNLWSINLGKQSVYGKKITANEAEAAKWLQRAEAIAVARPVPANFTTLGRVYSDNDKAAAIRWFEKGAALDDPDAQFYLGRAHALGDGVPRDLNRALQLMTKVAGRDLGSSSHQWAGSIAGWLGDRQKQIIWYRTAWQQGRRGPPPGYSKDLIEWFKENGISECGKTIWNNDSCPK